MHGRDAESEDIHDVGANGRLGCLWFARRLGAHGGPAGQFLARGSIDSPGQPVDSGFVKVLTSEPFQAKALEKRLKKTVLLSFGVIFTPCVKRINKSLS